MSNAAPEPAPVYIQLRERILNLEPETVDISPSSENPHVWGVIVETGYDVGTATLVCLVDGTTSLYYSTGGGMLGSGEYASLAEASKELVAQAEDLLPQVSPAIDYSLPEIGQVRFIFLTYNGTYSAGATQGALAGGDHPLSPLFAEAQNTLTKLRLLAEKK
ncbi:MAG: hypothetical protein A2136_02785 [Chloroflexi bacterium RBG_16_54_11]|nr:MAG: hypothetical protein A2136_02785 [Chloroflexi bacterium RBG_16_54_11]